jgi:hypothetical protein
MRHNPGSNLRRLDMQEHFRHHLIHEMSQTLPELAGKFDPVAIEMGAAPEVFPGQSAYPCPVFEIGLCANYSTSDCCKQVG